MLSISVDRDEILLSILEEKLRTNICNTKNASQASDQVSKARKSFLAATMEHEKFARNA